MNYLLVSYLWSHSGTKRATRSLLLFFNTRSNIKLQKKKGFFSLPFQIPLSNLSETARPDTHITNSYVELGLYSESSENFTTELLTDQAIQSETLSGFS